MGMAGEVETPRSSGREEKIFVSVRLRPLNEKEISRSDFSDWECINDNTIISPNSLSISERSMYPTAYTFDRVFSPDSSTRQVYEEGAKEVALSVVSGINASVFAYGQTSSGKTYTMTGITDYTLADIYDCIERHKDREFILKFCAMEIYNESVRDLLSSDSSQLRLLDDPEKGTVVEKLTEEILRDWKHFRELLSVCEAQRQIGETALNEASSRSHQILRLTVESSPRELSGNDKLSTLTANVNFVDLAGSERASQSLSAGTRLKEGCHINRSLLTLGTVIRKLSKGRGGHIPFRDSKLTRILQPSLGGNSRTAIICTLSPARIHLEQSRNTLLFAMCAKEVITNAQVNIVMSDKVLVKHLQRELARLESELRNSAPTFATSDSAALLSEKDLEIEKLKNEVRELTMQRDLALSQVDSLRRLVQDEESSTEWGDLNDQYPKLRVRNSSQRYSWDSENPVPKSPIIADTRSEHVGVRISNTSPQSDKHSRTGSDENLFQLPDFKVNFAHTSPSQQPTIRVPSFVETDMHQEETGEKPEQNNEESCKEVLCIEIEKSSSDRYAESNSSDPSSNHYEDSSITSSEVNTVNLGLTEVENENGKRQKFETMSHSLLLNEEKELNTNHTDFIFPSPEKSSMGLLEKGMCGSRSLKLVRSRSCNASLMTSPFSPCLEREGNNSTTPSNWLEKDFSDRHVGIPRKCSFLKYDIDRDRSSSNEQTCINDNINCEPEAQNVTTSKDDQNNCLETIIEEVKEITTDQYGKQPADPSVRRTEEGAVESVKNVKDVGLDPIQDFLPSSTWYSEFERLQREIIEYWDACNVSLAHRTYFFLLFNGDQKDSIYMEVELRRLSFIKDAFSRGSNTVDDGRILTPTTSLRALCRERQRLSQQIKKRLSTEETEKLFLKWGIGLNTKHRRLQLVDKLWSDSKDLQNVRESAAVVAKLLGFTDSGQGSKEMFGLNFALRPRTKKSSGWKRSVLSIL